MIKCKRCGKEITSLKQAIYNKEMEKFKGICSSCTTDKENDEIKQLELKFLIKGEFKQ